LDLYSTSGAAGHLASKAATLPGLFADILTLLFSAVQGRRLADQLLVGETQEGPMSGVLLQVATLGIVDGHRILGVGDDGAVEPEALLHLPVPVCVALFYIHATGPPESGKGFQDVLLDSL